MTPQRPATGATQASPVRDDKRRAADDGRAPAHPDQGWSRSRWPWGVAAAVVVVLAAVLVPLLVSRGGNAQTPVAATPSAVPTTETPQPPPAGYRLYRDPAGWTIAVPADWSATRNRMDAAVTFRAGDRALTVTRHDGPPDDPYANQLQNEPIRRAAIAGYHLMSIARATYRHWPTSDWEYRAGRLHTLIRSTVPDVDRAYDLTWTTQDSRWAADRTYLDTFTSTFDAG